MATITLTLELSRTTNERIKIVKQFILNVTIIISVIILFVIGMSMLLTTKHTITNGVVINKYTTEPRTIMTPIHAGKVTTFVPRHIPKKYHIVISGKTDKGKEVEEDFTIPESDYEKYNKGDQFNYNNVTNKEQE